MTCPLRRPLLHLHFSRSGGTAFCAHIAARCPTWPSHCQDRAFLQDGPWWVPDPPVPSGAPWPVRMTEWHKLHFAYPRTEWPHRRSCALRRRAFAKFTAVESPLPAVCNGTDHSAVFREPLQRAESQARELVRWGLVPKAGCASYDVLARSFPALFDNYHVRMLAGNEIYRLPRGTIGAPHMQRAVARLCLFSLAVPLANASAPLVALTRGATSGLQLHATARPGRRCEFSLHAAAAFWRDNQWDRELYHLVLAGRVHQHDACARAKKKNYPIDMNDHA